ncbi:YybH family protein [Paenibacillus sediminis]|nr:nuclear transport factor 2 family protein [Paenibacillus sediminis]
MDYKKALEEYIAATNSHQFSNVQKIVDENAVYWFSNKTCTTINEIREYFENAWNTVQNEVYTATNVEWIAVDNNCATCIYTYNWEGYHEGKFVSGSGRATNVFVKKSDGNWKIVHEHLSPK